MAAIPNTNPASITTEPNTLPIIISLYPNLVDSMANTNSGKDVPIATISSPMINIEIGVRAAIFIAAKTTPLLPIKRIAIPNRNKAKYLKKSKIFFLKLVL